MGDAGRASRSATREALPGRIRITDRCNRCNACLKSCGQPRLLVAALVGRTSVEGCELCLRCAERCPQPGAIEILPAKNEIVIGNQPRSEAVIRRPDDPGFP